MNWLLIKNDHLSLFYFQYQLLTLLMIVMEIYQSISQYANQIVIETVETIRLFLLNQRQRLQILAKLIVLNQNAAKHHLLRL